MAQKPKQKKKSYSNITTDWYFYSENDPKDPSGKYWYYDNGVPTSWNNN